MAAIDRLRHAIGLAEQQPNTQSGTLDFGDRCTEMVTNALTFELIEHNRGEIGILARQNSRRDIDDGDVAAEAPEGLRHLAPDRSTAENDQMRNRLAQIEDR